ncbi:MAG TPA: DUF3662 and FHA domain-containing protein [Nakamurella multipartita]|nr:DUF3662 and FHA domain-containing protein [Nakamurella multipartita]
MGVIQTFERKLQGAVGNTFARLFGGKVQPAEVADALQREAADHVQHQGAVAVAPNHYKVSLGPTDQQGLSSADESVATALSDMIREYLNQQGWQTFGDISVTLEQSQALHTGQFRISSFVDPDVGRRSSQARAGVGRMSQQPGDYGRDSQGRSPDQGDRREPDGRSYPGTPNQYGQQPGYGPDQGQANPGYPPQPYDAPGYGQRGWDPQSQQWEQQYGQQPPPGYPQQNGPQQNAPQYPSGPGGWDQGGGYQQPGYPQGYPPPDYQQGYGQPGYQNYPQQPAQPNWGQNYGVPAAGPQEITATLSVDDGSGRSYQLQRGSNVIGRGQDASFRLADTSVSRRHVDIYFDGQSAVLHDLGSTNGTTVNGSSVQTWQLADGDVIHIGHSTVVFSSRY